MFPIQIVKRTFCPHNEFLSELNNDLLETSFWDHFSSAVYSQHKIKVCTECRYCTNVKVYWSKKPYENPFTEWHNVIFHKGAFRNKSSFIHGIWHMIEKWSILPFLVIVACIIQYRRWRPGRAWERAIDVEHRAFLSRYLIGKQLTFFVEGWRRRGTQSPLWTSSYRRKQSATLLRDLSHSMGGALMADFSQKMIYSWRSSGDDVVSVCSMFDPETRGCLALNPSRNHLRLLAIASVSVDGCALWKRTNDYSLILQDLWCRCDLEN